MRVSASPARSALVGLILLPFETASAESPWRVVALTEETAPGTNLPFTSFHPPTLNRHGDIAFLGRVPRIDEAGEPIPCLRGGAGCILTTTGAWRSLTGGLLDPLVVPGEELTAAPSPVESVMSVVMNNSGTSAVFTQFSAGRGIYQTRGDELLPAAVIGQAVGTEPLVFGQNVRWPAISDSGELLFYADTIDPVTDERRVSYWVGNDTFVERGPPLRDFRFGFSDHGQLAFSRVVIGQASGYGVYLGDLQSQQVVLRSGMPAPGTDSIFGYPQPPSVNDDGQFVVHVSLGSTIGPVEGTGIWTGNATDLVPVVLSGEDAPGTNAAFESFNRNPSINNSGMIAFSALLAGDGISQSNQQGLWKGTPGALNKVVQQGDPAPGTEAYFGRLALLHSDGFYYWHDESAPFALNNHGQMAFIAQLTGPEVTSENDSGLWVESLSGELTLLLREGDLISVGSDDTRQVAGFQFRFGGSYGSSFTDLGQLALHVNFTDGSQAILINNLLAVPEPGLVGWLWAMIGIWLWRRSRAQEGHPRVTLPAVRGTDTFIQ